MHKLWPMWNPWPPANQTKQRNKQWLQCSVWLLSQSKHACDVLGWRTGLHGLAMALNCTAQWTVVNVSSFFVENPCPSRTEIGGIPLTVASYRGEKPHTFRLSGFDTLKTLESGKTEKKLQHSWETYLCMNSTLWINKWYGKRVGC